MHWHARCIHQDCIPAPLDALACASIRQDRICALFSTGRTGMREHTPGLRPRCAGCTGMRDAYTRTASPHRWMRWHARAYTRTASAYYFYFFLNRHAHAPRRIYYHGCTWHARAYARNCIAALLVHWHARAYTRTASLRCATGCTGMR